MRGIAFSCSNRIYLVALVFLFSSCGPASSSKENKQADTAVKESKMMPTKNTSAEFATADMLLQALLDEANDGKLENWAQFYPNASDLQDAEILPLVRTLSKFRGASSDIPGMASHFQNMAATDQKKIAVFFNIIPTEEHRNLYANTFQKTTTQKVRAKKWLSHSGQREYLYMRNPKICFICKGHPSRNDHSFNAALIHTRSGWKVCNSVDVGHCY